MLLTDSEVDNDCICIICSGIWALVSYAPKIAASTVLKGIEEHKAKGCNPKEVQDKARKLADEHLKVKGPQL